MKKPSNKNDLTHERISADIEAFLNNGGKIEQIPRGVTGGHYVKYGRSIDSKDNRSK